MTEPNGAISSDDAAIAALARDVIAMQSVLVERAKLAKSAGLMYGGDRDIWEVLGYNTEPTYETYCAKYERQDIAKRIVDQPIDATWRELPSLTDDDEAEEETAFEAAWRELNQRHRLIARFKRFEKLAALGEYAVMLFGIAGQGDMKQPLTRSGRGLDALLYLQPYSQPSAQIDAYDEDPASPRYGWPTLYSLQTQLVRGQRAATISQQAHWSRCVHASGENLEHDLIGQPVLAVVLNLLDDLLKVVGGGAETYWAQATATLHANTDPNARPMTATQITDLKAALEEMRHKLRRELLTTGIELQQLAPGVADPRGAFDVIMKLISAATGIPIRILTGSEQGQLASAQDDKNYADRIAERQLHHAEPKILRPTVDLLINAGVLPEPQGGEYEVQWGSLADPDEDERAATVDKWASAAQKFAQSRAIIDVSEVRERYFDLPPDHPNPPSEPEELIPEADGGEDEEEDDDDEEPDA